MAKEIPYFKFFTGEYLSGDITLCDIKTQGIFVNLCCYYWNKQGHYLAENVSHRFSDNDKEITELIDRNIIKIDGDVIRIDFLDAQLKERAMLHTSRVKAGRKGGSVKRLQASAKQTASKAKPIRKEKKRKEKIREDKIYREFAHLSLSEKEFENLKAKGISKEQIDDLCDRIENYKKNTNYKSLNLTIQSWYKLDKKRNPDSIDNGIGGM